LFCGFNREANLASKEIDIKKANQEKPDRKQQRTIEFAVDKGLASAESERTKADKETGKNSRSETFKIFHAKSNYKDSGDETKQKERRFADVLDDD